MHFDPADPTESAARAELTQIVRQVEHDKEEDTGFLQLFIRPTWRRRTFSVIFLM
jgi:hypothetical protein